MRLLLYILLFFCQVASAAETDSAFIATVTQYAAKQLGLTTEKYFSSWHGNTDPYYCLFVSYPDTIAPLPEAHIYLPCDTRIEADSVSGRYTAEGQEVFIYTAYANSDTRLHVRLMTYSRAAICFIVFHELMHNYTFKHLWLPYAYHEAMCDVVAAYGALKFAKETGLADPQEARLFVRKTEQIYREINACARDVNRDCSSRKRYQARCQEKIRKKLADADTFMRDRFSHPVNNGYLLKNGYYATYYFKLKRWLEEDKELEVFLGRMKGLFPRSPDNKEWMLKW